MSQKSKDTKWKLGQLGTFGNIRGGVLTASGDRLHGFHQSPIWIGKGMRARLHIVNLAPLLLNALKYLTNPTHSSNIEELLANHLVPINTSNSWGHSSISQWTYYFLVCKFTSVRISKTLLTASKCNFTFQVIQCATESDTIEDSFPYCEAYKVYSTWNYTVKIMGGRFLKAQNLKHCSVFKIVL